MENEFMKRGFLLPEGCKDLIDVWTLKGGSWQVLPSWPPPTAPLVLGELIVGETTTVYELATLLNLKPFKIVADLLEIGVFASADDLVDFDTLSRVVRKYGYVAKKAF